MNFRNARLIFEGFYRKIEKIYFGSDLKEIGKINKELKYASKTDKLKIFHDSRRKLIEIRRFLNRIVIFLNTDNSLRI
jgi:hypothetical protein